MRLFRQAFTSVGRSTFLCAVVALLAAGPASADTVIDFNALESPTFQRYASHAEDGFTITFEHPTFSGDGFGVWGTGDSDYLGTPALSSLDHETRVTLSREDGGTFDLKSILLGEFRDGLNDNETGVTFTGGFNIVAFETDGLRGLEKFEFTGFTGLTSVSWTVGLAGGPGQVQVDDIVVAATPVVPLPAAAWGGIALCGMIGAGKFRRPGDEAV